MLYGAISAALQLPMSAPVGIVLQLEVPASDFVALPPPQENRIAEHTNEIRIR